MSLKTSLSCEIDDLIDEIMSISEKSYDEIESALITLCIYPENTKSFLMLQNEKDTKHVLDKFSLIDHAELKWVDDVLIRIFNETKIDKVYVTHAI
jgi:hypothetical protein